MLQMFVEIGDVPSDKDILLQFQRVSCEPGKPGEPSVENWHQDKVDKIAVVCVARDNVRGGLSQFKNTHDFFEMELAPGFMVIFNDADLFHRVTKINSEDGYNYGYRDVVLLASS